MWIEISIGPLIFSVQPVALRKESVDRNMLFLLFRAAVGVALRKESVDRNSLGAKADSVSKWSLSARRVWIEISTQCKL